jgi:hypothetical protein
MKNQKIIWSVIAVIIIIGIIIFISRGSSGSSSSNNSGSIANSSAGTGNSTIVIPATPVGQVATVSATTKSYQNPELGFSVDYPTGWGLTDSDSGPTFTMPTGGNAGIYTLQAQIYFVPGTCAFPPVATSTIVSRSTVNAGDNTFKMIKVNTTAHAQSYLDEMYTLQQGTTSAPSCYVFSFASTAATPVSVANQSIINNAATAFGTMVKSYTVVTGPAGQSESAHPNGN